jgi:hypothetical protein
MIPDITSVVNRGVDFLLNSQQEDGSYLSYSTCDPDDFENARKYHSVFSSSLILSCLCSLDENPRLKLIKDKIARFLLSQKSDYWSFGYWVRSSDESKTMPCPDDLDDTFCALSALMQYDETLIDGEALAKIVTLLTALEEEEGGPYRTWLVPPTAEEIWKDVDPAVNSNVAYFLSLQDIALPKVDSFIESVIDAGRYESPYYPSAYPIVYFISRFYRGDKSNRMQEFLLSKSFGELHWSNPLYTALAVSSMLNLGSPAEDIKEGISYLGPEDQQESWSSHIFCIDPAIEGKRYYAGSPALTTAFCLEALAKYSRTQESSKSKVSKPEAGERDFGDPALIQRIHAEATSVAKRRFARLESDLQTRGLDFIDWMLEKDRDRQIVLLPLFYRISLGECGKIIPEEFLIKICAANLLGWVAYTIYDDFLDLEGDPKLLPVANIALRELTAIFENILPNQSGFQKYFHEIMDAIESENEWDVVNCTIADKFVTVPEYGDYSRIARRSLGHALGPAAILFHLGYDAASVEFENLMSFFNHFLVARQLNDDAHDWEQDLKRGRINSVCARIIGKWAGDNVLSGLAGDELQNKLSELQQTFWYDIVVEICNTVLRNTLSARESLHELSLLKSTSLLEALLAPIENSAKKALEEQEAVIDFLDVYGGDEPSPFPDNI